MPDRDSRRRLSYSKQIALLEEQLAAVESDLASAPREVDRLRLKNSAESLLNEIEELQDKLDELDSQSKTQSIREGKLEQSLQKIDFIKAKETASIIRSILNQNGGSVLFFLQKSKRQMGRYCIEEVINIIMADQFIGGEILGAYRRYSVDLDSAISQYDEAEFLIRLASYFKLEVSDDLTALSIEIRKVIKSSIDQGSTVFLEIKSLDDLLEKDTFLKWFVQDFWQPLINEISAISNQYKSKLIVMLIADSQILSECPSDYFCDGDSFDCDRMLELPLPNWSIDDVSSWLLRFRTLSSAMPKTDVDRSRLARKIHRDSDGVPESICLSLREQFL